MGLASQSPLRRVVTHHNGTNSAVLIDDELQPFPAFASDAITIWQNKEYPAELVSQDTTESEGFIYTRGSLIRVVDFPPNSQGHNHGTASLDYGIVFDGELELVLQDSSRTIVRAGDIVVQQGVSTTYRSSLSLMPIF